MWIARRDSLSGTVVSIVLAEIIVCIEGGFSLCVFHFYLLFYH